MQTHAQAAYLAGAIACEIEARGYAGKNGFSSAALGNISRLVGKLPVFARHCWAKAVKDPAVSALVVGFDPPDGPTPPPDQGLFWLGYCHQKTARELPPTFPAKLARLREAANLSVPDLARKAEISDDAIRLYEKGERGPTWEAVQKLAAALGVPTDTFRDR